MNSNRSVNWIVYGISIEKVFPALEQIEIAIDFKICNFKNLFEVYFKAENKKSMISLLYSEKEILFTLKSANEKVKEFVGDEYNEDLQTKLVLIKNEFKEEFSKMWNKLFENDHQLKNLIAKCSADFEIDPHWIIGLDDCEVIISKAY